MSGTGTGTAAISTSDLITLAEAKVYPGMSGLSTADEAIVNALISSCTLDFEEYLGKALVQRAFTEDYTYAEISRQSRDSDIIWMRQYPIVSVTSITDPAANTIAATNYWIDKIRGALRANAAWSLPKDDNGFTSYWTIVYTAGHWATTAAVPANMKLAAKMYVAYLYSRPNPEVSSKSVGDLRLAYTESKSDSSIPASIRTKIDYLKSRM